MWEVLIVSIRQELRWLVDHLPESEALAAKRFLEFLTERGSDPVLRALVSAPQDSEPLTKEEQEALDEALEEMGRGEVVPHDEMRRMLGL